MKSAVILHASRAAVDCVAEYYAAQAPEFEFTHLLDDGVMRTLKARDWPRAGKRLLAMAEDARREYGASQAVLTCSAYPTKELAELKAASPIPMFKIDEPMARAAVHASPRIGILSTFPATKDTARDLLQDAARSEGREVELVELLDAEALQALLQGDRETHDTRFFDACRNLASQKIGVLVLAQVSMARLRDEAARITGVPVFESLSTSLAALRQDS